MLITEPQRVLATFSVSSASARQVAELEVAASLSQVTIWNNTEDLLTPN